MACHCRRMVLGLLGLSALGCALASAGEQSPTAARPAGDPLIHLLSRATFAPLPSEIAEIRSLGAEAWVDVQLEPERLPDPNAQRRLARLRSLGLDGQAYFEALEALRSRPSDLPGAGEDRLERARMGSADLELVQAAAVEVPASVLLRAVYSRRQLFEVLCNFWRNHFNVDVSKDEVRYYVADWERTVLRAHALGRFEEFLLATARHPAMLFYLDNHVSRAPLARGERLLQGRERADRTRGLNENYARELMELHTVGCDNGYDQDDVIQLALALTGWTIGRRSETAGSFVFDPEAHARGKKRVMGKTVKGSGVEEAEEILLHLARHPHTRRFMVEKLVSYFVADDPPEEMVQDVVEVWKQSGGDLKAVTRAVLLHPDFAQPRFMGSKVRTPLEFVAACLRVTGADVQDASPILGHLEAMAQPVYRCEDPTGWSDKARDWMDPGVMAGRWRFARALLYGRIPGTSVPASWTDGLLGEGPERWTPELVGLLLAGRAPGRRTLAPLVMRRIGLAEEWRDQDPEQLRRELSTWATLLLGSPEFQRQ